MKRLFSKILNALTLLFLFGCHETTDSGKLHQASEMVIRIKGSDTEFLMVEHLARIYMQEHPTVKISVEGGGSNKGIKALINKEVDICNSSREILEIEINSITNKEIRPIPIIFSVDALAIITHYKVGVDSLSTLEVTKIFNGQIKNWKELGGDDIPIQLFGRDKSSGTRDYFTSKFLSADSSNSIKECSSNSNIVEFVTKTPGAIGYVGTGFLYDSSGKPNGKIWAMPVYINNHRAISPYESSLVKKGEYILTRPLYQYINGTPSPLIEDFILFELTKIGQDIIMQHGFYPINDYQKEINTLKGIPR